jgi:hypothetical protein
MRPVSIALGGVFALIVAGAAVAEPLNPQPLPAGAHALNPQPLPPGRQAGAAYVLTACASGKHAPMDRMAGGSQSQTVAASHGSGGGPGKVQTACASGKH